jgi:DNA-binding transcriptional LysR family regulator
MLSNEYFINHPCIPLMHLNQLRHATVLAQTGSFVRAAKELNLTQPALSRSIAALERELGVRLFERGRQGAKLTREGSILVERAEQIRLTLGGLRHDIGLSKTGQLGEVGFGLGPAVAAIFLADLLSGLIRDYPRLEVRSYVNNADQLRDALLAERIDFFVHSEGQLDPNPRIAIAPLGAIPLSLFVRAGHPRAKRKNATREDVSCFPLVTGNLPLSLKTAGSAIVDLPQSLKINFRCDDFLTLKMVVLRTDAVWLTPCAVVLQECRRGKIVELKNVKSVFRFAPNLIIASLVGRTLSPTANLVIQTIRDLFQQFR